MTRWHGDACRCCWCCLPAVETHFSALLETAGRFSVLLETGFSVLLATDRRFSVLLETGFSVLLETDRRFSVLLETGFCFLVESETCCLVRRRLQFRFLGGRLKVAAGTHGGGGGVDSCGVCDVVSTATCAAAVVGWMCGCGDALAKAVCAASAVSGKCQRRGPVSSRQPERRGWPSG